MYFFLSSQAKMICTLVRGMMTLATIPMIFQGTLESLGETKNKAKQTKQIDLRQ